MGFVQPCFIESVDSDVIERLKELGYWYCQNGHGEWYIPVKHCQIEGLLECDAVYFAPGWVDSKGCNLEYAAARIYGKTIYT